MTVFSRLLSARGQLLALLAAGWLIAGQAAAQSDDPPPKKAPPAEAEQKDAGKQDVGGLELDLPEPGADGRLSEEQQQQLMEQIRKAIEAEMKQAAQEKPEQKPAPKSDPDNRYQTARVGDPRTSAQIKAKATDGCGATPGGDAIDLNPPPADQPQPKLVCEETKIVKDGVWQGQTAEFTFKLKNEGEGPLAIRLKGG